MAEEIIYIVQPTEEFPTHKYMGKEVSLLKRYKRHPEFCECLTHDGEVRIFHESQLKEIK